MKTRGASSRNREIPPGASIRWVSARMSPSRGTTGNVRRWLFANHLARLHRDALVFGLSQLEAPIVGGRGIVMVHDLIPWLFGTRTPGSTTSTGITSVGRSTVRTPWSRRLRRQRMTCAGTTALKGARVHVIRHGSPVPMSGSAKRDKHRDRVHPLDRPDRHHEEPAGAARGVPDDRTGDGRAPGHCRRGVTSRS